ncbi:uncharacterized protein LOC116413775 [Galleria mellonella]|uniref:Uncharacterized protein LOC116413775 n=1 Tax=Galleria mellonella TaxID=7137 RepID=A0ABM3MB86_GALME|nr:uncharacterized protein LOC116413775 [Galleria mellonella]
MIKIVFCSLLTSMFTSTLDLYAGDESGPGSWSVDSVGSCATRYPSNFYMTLHKPNSTAGEFNGTLYLPDGIDDYFSVTYEYTKLDGADHRVRSSAYRPFIYEYTKDAIDGQCHTAAETYPFYFPIPPGLYLFNDYIYHYKDTQLPAEGVYGTFDIYGYLNHRQERVGCMKLRISFQNNKKLV